MTAYLHEITARSKDSGPEISRLADFTLGPSQVVSSDIILASPDWSLYCLDFAQGKALFLEMPAGTNLAERAFVYGAQFDLAKRAITVPLNSLENLAKQIPLPSNLAFLFSTGRCGSTLASRILAQLPNVWSLSEPDCYTNLAFERFTLSRDLAKALIAATTRLICRPPLGLKVETIVIKPRSEAIMQAELFVHALPEARNIFMYRDAEGFVNSLYQFEQRALGAEILFSSVESWRVAWHFISVNAPLTLLDDYFGKERGEIPTPEINTMAWLIRIEGYLAALDHGVPFQALHYNDLNTNRRVETERLLKGCGLSSANLHLAMRGFEKDSHSGASTDNSHKAVPLGAEQRGSIHAMLRRLGKSDYLTTRLPDTVSTT